MKPIKFRAFWPGVNKMRYFTKAEITVDSRKRWGLFFATDEGSVFMGNAKVMNFINLKDRTGRDIYEGDILKFKTGIAVVIWWNYMWAVESPGSEAIDEIDLKEWNSSLIIGNKFENSELLEL